LFIDVYPDKNIEIPKRKTKGLMNSGGKMDKYYKIMFDNLKNGN